LTTQFENEKSENITNRKSRQKDISKSNIDVLDNKLNLQFNENAAANELVGSETPEKFGSGESPSKHADAYEDTCMIEGDDGYIKNGNEIAGSEETVEVGNRERERTF
jgi:hypothetical protein